MINNHQALVCAKPTLAMPEHPRENMSMQVGIAMSCPITVVPAARDPYIFPTFWVNKHEARELEKE